MYGSWVVGVGNKSGVEYHRWYRKTIGKSKADERARQHKEDMRDPAYAEAYRAKKREQRQRRSPLTRRSPLEKKQEAA
jgi:hypothetical protein